MKLSVQTKQGRKSNSVDVPDAVFKASWNPNLVHQVFVSHLANNRKVIANTKDRREVRGGGRKPWRQKGTGRARHGSIRSPLWRGGGVTFGPNTLQNYRKKVNKKMKTRALFSLLSKKFADDELRVVDSLKLDTTKTKDARDELKNFLTEGSSVLFIPSAANKDFNIAVRNIKMFKAMSPLSLNVRDLLENKLIVFEKQSIDDLINHFK